MSDNFNSKDTATLDTNCSLQLSTKDTNVVEDTNCSSIMQYSTGDTNGIVNLSVLLLTYLLALLGFTGNLVSIYILQNRRIVSNFNRLLIMLSYFDAAYIFLFLIEQLPPLIETIKQRPEAASTIHSYLYPPLYVYFLHPFQEVLQTSAVVMMTVISIDRYIAVMHPFLVESSGLLCRVFLKGPTQSGAFLYSFCVLLFSIGITFPHFMDYQVMDMDGLTYIALYWKADFYYCLVYRTIIDFFLRILLPIFVMRRNYSQIYKLVQLWEPDGRRQTLFSMTAVFVVTMLPKVLSLGYLLLQHQPVPKVVANLVEIVRFDDLVMCGLVHLPAWDIILNVVGGCLHILASYSSY